MKICFIGQNLTNLILATVFVEKNLNIDFFISNKIKNSKTNRTIAISAENFKYLKNLSDISLPAWKTEEIKIYTEDLKSKELINFKKKNREAFNLISYSKLNKIFLNKIKRSKLINFIKSNNSSPLLLNKIKNYDLVINTESKNIISKKYFTNKIKKNYKSYAYTFTINHKKINNYTASQIFTKYGPIAFLPFSNTNTSIVFSCIGKQKNNEEILKLFNKYNFIYNVNKTGIPEKFELNFSMLRNYTYKNILAFGDIIHRVHPLAGQGFNMTIRDIKILSKIIQERTNLGLPIDSSVAYEFQKSTKHLNYLYGKAIDGIYEFFKLDSAFHNSISKPIFSILNKNQIFKKYSNIFSEKGLNF